MTTEDKQIVILRKVVKILGIILILGTCLVFSLALNKLLNKHLVKNKNDQDIKGFSEKNESKCSNGEVSIANLPDGEISSVSYDHGKLILIIKKNAKYASVAVIDVCNGSLLRNIKL